MNLRRRIPLISRISLVLLFIYAQVLGANSRGILVPESRSLTLWILLLSVTLWLLARWRMRWSWYRSSLDPIVVVWGLALLLSLLGNLSEARGIAIGLWYAGVYTAIAYVLLDLLNNRAITRQDLLSTFLLAGALAIVFACIELYITLAGGGGLDLRFSVNLRGLFINANALATFLLIYLIVLLGQIIRAPALLPRLLLIPYFGLCLVLMYLTSSRSAWLATALGIVALVLLHLLRHHVLDFSTLIDRWRGLKQSLRLAISAAGLVVVAVAGFLAYSGLSQNIGSAVSARGGLLRAAMLMFADKPLIGQGLSSYGWQMTRYWSVPAEQPFKNAHNFPVNVAGELGLVGLLALLVVLVLIVRAAIRHWRAAQGETQAVLAMGLAAAAGYAAHHLLDITSATPIIALCGTVLLVLILAPIQPDAITHAGVRRLKSAAIPTLWLVLLLTGLWDAQLNQRYTEALGTVISELSYAEVAQNFQQFTDADPSLSVYPAQQAYLWGLAAYAGDSAARQRAIETYEHVIVIEPDYAPYRANLAALYWEANQQDASLNTWQAAVDLAPTAWQMHYNLAAAAEAMDLPDVATEHYREALRLEPDADLHPAWGQTALQEATRNSFEAHSTLGQVILSLEAGQPEEAARIWEADQSFRNSHVYGGMWTLIALAQGDRSAAEAHFAQAKETTTTAAGQRGLLFAEAALARDAGELDEAEALSAAFRDTLDFSISTEDGNFHGADIAFYVYYRQVIIRQFLPQVFYPGIQPVAVYRLIAQEPAQPES